MIKSKKKSKNILRQTKMIMQLYKSMKCSKSSFKKKLHSDTILPQEIRKISNNLSSKGMRRKKKQSQQNKGNNQK